MNVLLLTEVYKFTLFCSNPCLLFLNDQLRSWKIHHMSPWPRSSNLILFLLFIHRVDVNNDKKIGAKEMQRWIMEKTDEHFQEAVEENKMHFRAVDPDGDGKMNNSSVSWWRLNWVFAKPTGCSLDVLWRDPRSFGLCVITTGLIHTEDKRAKKWCAPVSFVVLYPLFPCSQRKL